MSQYERHTEIRAHLLLPYTSWRFMFPALFITEFPNLSIETLNWSSDIKHLWDLEGVVDGVLIRELCSIPPDINDPSYWSDLDHDTSWISLVQTLGPLTLLCVTFHSKSVRRDRPNQREQRILTG